MSPLLRNILSIIAGTLLATAIMFLLEILYAKVATLPPGVSVADLKDPLKAKAAMAQMPTSAFMGILVIYAFSAFAGGITATLCAGKKSVVPALVMGFILLISGIMDGVQMAEPMWFMVVMSIAFLIFSWLGFAVVKNKKPKTAVS
ncbi:MAG: hypothetical protein JSS96_07870 [Bacteroidetes bacterium]|nr:hypothetical protein [Bacteroidota bacterium]